MVSVLKRWSGPQNLKGLVVSLDLDLDSRSRPQFILFLVFFFLIDGAEIAGTAALQFKLIFLAK